MNVSAFSRRLLLSLLGFVLASLCSAQVILEGNVLRVGVNTSGALVDNDYTVGIEVEPGGPDLLNPNAPFEFYAMGHSLEQQGAKFFDWLPGAVTVEQNSGKLLKAVTTGAMGDLQFEQTLSFDENSSIIDFSVRLLNAGASTLTDVFYARGLDANPDYYLGADVGAFWTNNLIESSNVVTSWGPDTRWAISIVADGDGQFSATPSIRSDWFGDFGGFDFRSLLTSVDAGNGNHSINMAWNVGALTPGAEATIDFQYRIHQIPPPAVPEQGATLPLLALAMTGVAFTFTGLCRRRAG